MNFDVALEWRCGVVNPRDGAKWRTASAAATDEEMNLMVDDNNVFLVAMMMIEVEAFLAGKIFFGGKCPHPRTPVPTSLSTSQVRKQTSHENSRYAL